MASTARSLTEEQRALSDLAHIFRRDPPEYQAEIYRPLRKLEARQAQEAAQVQQRWENEDEALEDILRRHDEVLAAARASEHVLVPSDRLPRATAWQRVKAVFADYFTAPY